MLHITILHKPCSLLGKYHMMVISEMKWIHCVNCCQKLVEMNSRAACEGLPGTVGSGRGLPVCSGQSVSELPPPKIPSSSPTDAGGKAILTKCAAILSLTATFALSGLSFQYQQLVVREPESRSTAPLCNRQQLPVWAASTGAATLPATADPA